MGVGTVCCLKVDEVGSDCFHKAVRYSFSDMKAVPARENALRRQKSL